MYIQSVCLIVFKLIFLKQLLLTEGSWGCPLEKKLAIFIQNGSVLDCNNG